MKKQGTTKPSLMEMTDYIVTLNLNAVQKSRNNPITLIQETYWEWDCYEVIRGLSMGDTVECIIRTKYSVNDEFGLINSFNKGVKIAEYSAFLKDVEFYKYLASNILTGTVVTYDQADIFIESLTYVRPTPVEVVNMTSSNLTASNYPTLPTSGIWLDVNTRWNDGGTLVQVRQAHFRTSDPVANIPVLFSVFRTDTGALAWIANEAVIVGSLRTYSTVQYKCIQAHTTQVGWEPNKTPALWVVVPASNIWAPGIAVTVNSVWTYQPNGKSYKCLQAHTTQAGWEPPNVPALWSLI